MAGMNWREVYLRDCAEPVLEVEKYVLLYILFIKYICIFPNIFIVIVAACIS